MNSLHSAVVRYPSGGSKSCNSDREKKDVSYQGFSGQEQKTSTVVNSAAATEIKMDKGGCENVDAAAVTAATTFYATSPQLGSQTLPTVSLSPTSSMVATSSVVINIPPSSSPCSPRLAHLRPQNPLMTPLEMQRINTLLTAEPVDPSKLSPISPLYPTSDLGSSPRSSISVTTSSSSSVWNVFRDQKMSSSDFTDCDSDCKDLFSPGILLSPAPFSPFSDGPPETPATADFVVSASSPLSGGGLGTSPNVHQRLRFTFDPKSPSFFTSGRSSQNFLLPPPTALGVVRERSRSDSETLIDAGTSSSVKSSNVQSSQSGGKSSTAYVAHKKVFKKQILERYQTEVSSTHTDLVATSQPTTTVDEELLRRHVVESQKNAAKERTSSTTAAYHTSSYQPGVELPILRLDPNAPPPPPVTLANFQNQTYFDWWLKQQISAANSIWFPGGNAPPLLSPLFPASSSTGVTAAAAGLAGRASLRTNPLIRPNPQLHHHHHHHQPTYLGATSSTLSIGKPCKRSRSESDMSYICQHCGQSFNLYDRLAKHIASRHRDRSSSVESPLKTHKCTVCHKAFGRSDMLTRHMRLHTGIKPYSCRVCGQVFSRSDHLSTHQRTHTGEKPYQCPQCSYAASRRDMITRHMRTHTRGRANTSSASSAASSTSSYRLSSSDGSSPGHESSGKQHVSPKSSSSHVSVIQHIGEIRGVRLPTSSGAVDDDDSDAIILEKARRLCVSPTTSGGGGRISSESVSTIMADEETAYETALETSASSSSTSTASELTPRVCSPRFQECPTTSNDENVDRQQHSSNGGGGGSGKNGDNNKSNSPYDINQLVGSISEINVKMEPG